MAKRRSDEREYLEQWTDMDSFQEGFMTQEETWWGKKIKANAERIRSGEFGEVKYEESNRSGWGDGVQIPTFGIKRDGVLIEVYANESGVFVKSPSGGAYNIDLYDKVSK